MQASKKVIIFCLSVCSFVVSSALAVEVATVRVDSRGNSPDVRYASPGYGAVDHVYNIGAFEITAGQYTEFLNAVALTDAYGLYNPTMGDTGSSARGCNIQRSGSAGSYSYSVAPEWANRPVNYVSWGDAVRFANWMHNGQPTTGVQDATTTETGAYALNGMNTAAPLLAVTRGAGALWFVPTEDEWYKAAFHKNDGPTGNYWDYATGTNAVPSNDVVSPDPGNNANFFQGGYSVGSPYLRSEAGEFENSESPYGTFDQAGNVLEWNEAIISANGRGVRGGSFFAQEFNLRATYRGGFGPLYETHDLGFRMATVPEPATIALAAFGLTGALLRRKPKQA